MKNPTTGSARKIAANELCWHAHHYTIDRRNCVLFCHHETRFTLFLAGLKKREFQDLGPWFQDAWLNTLLRLGYEAELIRKAAERELLRNL
jgi:hypothetical protein